MVEDCACPARGAVANGTICRECCSHVVRICCLIERRYVTRSAIFRSAGVSAAHMTLRTGNGDMCSCQWKRGHRIVVELCVQPRRGRMTLRARLRKSKAQVIWILGVVEISLVTTDAVRRGTLEMTSHVTRHAIEGRVSPCQWKTG